MITIENFIDYVSRRDKQSVSADVEACPDQPPDAGGVVSEKRKRMVNGVRERAV
jgi:hypothetical protein